jgi:3-oxoacyl-[acyl-carrier-protein] synthase-3
MSGLLSAPAFARATSPMMAYSAATWVGSRQECAPSRRLQPKDVDLIIVATSTPDMVFPSTACILQNKLGANGCAAFDVQAVCSGFVYALTVADAMIQTGAPSAHWLWAPKCFPAFWISRTAPPVCCLAMALARWCWKHLTSPAFWPAICMPTASMWAFCACPVMCRAAVLGDALLKMDGQAVFKLAVGVLESAARATLAKANLTEADIDWLVPHQANIRIMQSTARKLKLSMDKVVVTVDQHGNTSAASIPLALDCRGSKRQGQDGRDPDAGRRGWRFHLGCIAPIL